MVEILIAFVSVTGLSAYVHSTTDDDSLLSLYAAIFIFLGLICLTLYGFTAWSYFAAKYKKDIINREYGTDYTQSEVFYASDVIDTVRELHRKRMEINGNLFTGETCNKRQ